MPTPAPSTALRALDGLTVESADALACNGWLREIRRVRGWLDAVEAQVSSRLDALATHGESFGSADSHVRNSGISAKEAARRERRAKTIERVPEFGSALADGAVSAEHVDALTNATLKLGGEVAAAVFARADELLEFARAHSPGRFARRCRDLARQLERDAGTSRDERQRRDTRLSWRVDDDGMYEILARLHPEAGSALVTALQSEVNSRVKAGEQAGIREYVDRTVDRARLMAEALVDFVSAGHQHARPLVADITLLVDERTLVDGELHEHSVCETSHGAALSVASVRRLICTGIVTPIILGADGNPLNAGRTVRHANRSQRRALRAMYRTCAAGGCDVPFDRCEIHHIWESERLGPTDLANMLPLCSRHHHLTHDLGWRLHLAPDRTLTVTGRNGDIVMVATPDMPDSTGRRRRRGRRTEPAPAGGPHQLEPEALLAS
jgi:hypothetical protein